MTFAPGSICPDIIPIYLCSSGLCGQSTEWTHLCCAPAILDKLGSNWPSLPHTLLRQPPNHPLFSRLTLLCSDTCPLGRCTDATLSACSLLTAGRAHDRSLSVLFSSVWCAILLGCSSRRFGRPASSSHPQLNRGSKRSRPAASCCQSSCLLSCSNPGVSGTVFLSHLARLASTRSLGLPNTSSPRSPES